eukprot:2241299-Pleurochrysis_carterae.AAC.1
MRFLDVAQGQSCFDSFAQKRKRPVNDDRFPRSISSYMSHRPQPARDALLQNRTPRNRPVPVHRLHCCLPYGSRAKVHGVSQREQHTGGGWGEGHVATLSRDKERFQSTQIIHIARRRARGDEARKATELMLDRRGRGAAPACLCSGRALCCPCQDSGTRRAPAAKGISAMR